MQLHITVPEARHCAHMLLRQSTCTHLFKVVSSLLVARLEVDLGHPIFDLAQRQTLGT
jgi:hypothetical protein